MPEGEPKFEDENIEPDRPERRSSVMKVIGATPEQERQVMDDFEEILETQSTDIWETEKWDKEKTEYEKEIIDRIVRNLPDFVRSYGGVPIQLTVDNFHILDTKVMKKDMDEGDGRAGHHLRSDGFANLPDQRIVALDYPQNAYKEELLVHEAMHLESFNSVKYFEFHTDDKKQRIENSARLFQTRSGFDMQKGYGDLRLHAFSEGITQALTIKFMQKTHPIPEIGEMLGHITSEGKFTGEVKGRLNEVNLVRKIMKDIRSYFPKEFPTEDDVFKIFAEGYFSGNMLATARLIEKRYGKGSFRYLAEKDSIPKHNDLPINRATGRNKKYA